MKKRIKRKGKIKRFCKKYKAPLIYSAVWVGACVLAGIAGI